jgi:bifunctional DNA-binding transcriptional regulator/antitoxin component of YhaV-PrlF toxin-antitoxin module
MREIKVSAKNQIVISREVREALGVKAGDPCSLFQEATRSFCFASQKDTQRRSLASAKIFINQPTSTRRGRAGGSR